jgi:hypothetical protein
VSKFHLFTVFLTWCFLMSMILPLATKMNIGPRGHFKHCCEIMGITSVWEFEHLIKWAIVYWALQLMVREKLTSVKNCLHALTRTMCTVSWPFCWQCRFLWGVQISHNCLVYWQPYMKILEFCLSGERLGLTLARPTMRVCIWVVSWSKTAIECTQFLVFYILVHLLSSLLCDDVW